MSDRVVITGSGIVSPIGIGVETFWQSAIEGRCGISRLDPFPDLELEHYRCQVAGKIRDFDMSGHPDEGQAGRIDPYARFALVAAREAVEHAGLDIGGREDAHRVAVIAGVGMGGMVMGEREIEKLYRGLKPHRVHPNFIPTITLNSGSGVLGIAHGAKGPNLAISTACSSSAHAIGQGFQTIRSGQADVVIAAGADASITPLVFAGFANLRTLSTNFNDRPEAASRPFDRDRDGFVMGEGAACLILESERHARSRGATILGEVAGYAAAGEAHHMVIPREDGEEIAHTIALALQNADTKPEEVDAISAHATSTPIGDAVEARAIRLVFGDRADEVLVNATKSLVGHTLGAAGAIAAVSSVKALETGLWHPTLNYENPEDDCRLGGISTETQDGDLKTIMLNAFGFGSNNAALVLKRVDG